MLDVVGVIPARYGAQRFPGKPLALILGKPLIQWVVEGVAQSQKLKAVVVATDDQRIAEVVQSLGVEVVMTSSDLATGSDRVWQAVKNRKEPLVLNIQGDEPLINGAVVDTMVERMTQDSAWEMVTLGRKIDGESLLSPQTAKIVCNANGEALYFSRHPIPYSRTAMDRANGDQCLKHIGIYGYQKKFLQRFCECGETPLEKMEGLEQLRALYLGARISVLPVEFESWGVDIPEDIPRVEEKLRTLYGK